MGQRGGRKKEDRREGRGELHCPIPTPTPQPLHSQQVLFQPLQLEPVHRLSQV